MDWHENSMFVLLSVRGFTKITSPGLHNASQILADRAPKTRLIFLAECGPFIRCIDQQIDRNAERQDIQKITSPFHKGPVILCNYYQVQIALGGESIGEEAAENVSLLYPAMKDFAKRCYELVSLFVPDAMPRREMDYESGHDLFTHPDLTARLLFLFVLSGLLFPPALRLPLPVIL